jgi:putative SOS response-associated peptidase YedK
VIAQVCASIPVILPLPATGFYEPNWETGKAVRWRIGLPDGEPFAIAGLWRTWPDGAVSFTMPTLNADSHLLMQRFHKPEMRSAAL